MAYATDYAGDDIPCTVTAPPEEEMAVIYPADVQMITEEGTRRIEKTYILANGQSPVDIPRDDIERDGWVFTLTDITERRTSATDTRSHTETVEIETDGNDLNEIVALLLPAMDYHSEDGYSGVLTLELASVSCEPAGYRNSRYTVTATREYPHLSNPDTSLIPKSITDNGRDMVLESVSWQAQSYINVDYVDIPESYCAVATYTVNATRRVVTGYITTASYSGEVTRTTAGDTVYTAYFTGTEIPPPTPEVHEPETSTPTTVPPPQPAPEPGKAGGGNALVPLMITLALPASLACIWALLRLRRRAKNRKGQ